MRTFIRVLLAAVISAAACASAPRTARAAWGVDPVTVTSTTATIPTVEGCSDGAYGSFAAWQEGSPTGTLRAQHLLPNGDLDPAWPAVGASASNVLAARSELVALPDRLGGLYLVWKEGATLLVTRLDASGAVAAGWPAGGRSLGDVNADSPRPGVIEDGAHGFYAVWVSAGSWVDKEVFGIHLGPSSEGAGGWPNEPILISLSEPEHNMFTTWPQLAPAPDGGIFVAWASYGGAYGGWIPGSWKLTRLTPSGYTADGWPGWPDFALSLGDFHYEYIGDHGSTAGSLLALAEDGRGGVFFMKGDPTGGPGRYPPLETRLYRLTGSGEAAPDWPAGGVVVPQAVTSYACCQEPDASDRLLFDHRDGVFVGAHQFRTETSAWVDFRRCDAGGQFGAEDYGLSCSPPDYGFEIVARGDGAFFTAYFSCCSYVYWPTTAKIFAGQIPSGAYVYEQHNESYGQWYDDIGLARTDDGGAVFLWSQEQGRVGLFARRLNSAGEVTAVGPGARPDFGLSRVRFVRGEGVRAVVSVPAGPARFDLYDVAGRRIVSQPVEPGADEITIAGTARLASGLYFGRLVAGADAVAAKLIVAR